MIGMPPMSHSRAIGSPRRCSMRRGDFAGEAGQAADRARVREQFVKSLSRARPKELVHDYLDRDAAARETGQARTQTPGLAIDEIEVRQQLAAERWRATERAREQGLKSGSELQQPSREGPEIEADRSRSKPRSQQKERARGGPEDDFGL
jgi:hypothetical protein